MITLSTIRIKEKAIIGAAFDLMENDPGYDSDLLEVFDSSANMLAQFPVDVSSDTQFIGVVSDTPIWRVYMNEGDDGDNIAIGNFRFGSQIPEPSTALLLGVGGLLALYPKRAETDR